MKSTTLMALGAMSVGLAAVPTCASEPWPTDSTASGACVDRVPEHVLADRLAACASELSAASCDPEDTVVGFPTPSTAEAAGWLSRQCESRAEHEALPVIGSRAFVDPSPPHAHLHAVPVSRTDDARGCFGGLAKVATVANGEWAVLRQEDVADPSAQRIRRLERALAGWDHTTWPSHHRSCDAPPMTTADLTCDVLAELMGCD
jgi:hypothetical protein